MAPRSEDKTLVAIGNFDGVHRGHALLLRKAVDEARAEGLRPVVLTFDPHPAAVVGRTPPPVLTPRARKVELLEAVAPGLEVVVKRFDGALAATGPEEFIRDVLVAELRAGAVVVGENFRFGKGRAGSFADLERLGATHGFVARRASLAGDDAGRWSSTRARAAVAAGECELVSGVLGRPHALTGVVVEGDRRGRTLGFPTANLANVEEALPPHGVYAVLVDDVGRASRALARGVANVGVRPTMGAGASIEAHLFDFDGEIYGARLRLHLVARLRAEKKFDGLEALKAQIAEDAADARRLVAPAVASGPGGGWH